MSRRSTVYLEDKPVYDIMIETSYDKLAREVEGLGAKNKKICIVTDTTVADYYLREIKNLFERSCYKLIVFIFPAGEISKNLDTVNLLYRDLIENHFERTDMLVALGGGVVGDLCGYCAATYLRGISFVQIPTTLLSQVDSSIGGKTGVDYLSYKNMIGAFHMPDLVYINIKTLLTLSNEQYSSGMGEIIKHGLIKDSDYYLWLKEHISEIMNRDLEICEEMISRSNEIKRHIVEKDPKEKGDRALLNFGHTFGHAVEKLKEFQLLHGQCVALGCVGAAYLSFKRERITIGELNDIENTMIHFGLPVSVEGLSVAELMKVTKSDKKMAHGVIKFILLEKIGSAYIDSSLSEEEMMEALSYIMS